jgi:3-deoxy-7-phosphoheptulonate synthase
MESKEDRRIQSYKELPSPESLIIPINNHIVNKTRNDIHNILTGVDKRFVVFVGPCSIHSEKSAIDFAERLYYTQRKLPNLLLVMRFFLQKPRTTVGWTGFLEDPNINGDYDILSGLERSVHLAHHIVENIQQPICMELLGTTIEPQYFSTYLSTGFIGARTSESQLHRNLASGVSFPIGIKNSSDGSAKTALDGVIASRVSRTFCGINKKGKICSVKTTGNEDAFVVLRGSYRNGPNIDSGVSQLEDENVAIVVDCAHGNSHKDLEKQCENAIKASHIPRVCGLMIESHILEGKQDAVANCHPDKSITDPCMGWENTVKLLERINEIRN